MVALGASNWNIPIGKLEGEEQLTFDMENSKTEKYEYRLFSPVGGKDSNGTSMLNQIIQCFLRIGKFYNIQGLKL